MADRLDDRRPPGAEASSGAHEELSERMERLSPEKRELLDVLLGAKGVDLERRSGETVPPRNSVEASMASIWCEVLGREVVGVHDDYFALGGDSIHSIQIVAKANRAGLAVSATQLFEKPTIAELCEGLEETAGLSTAAGGAGDPDQQSTGETSDRLEGESALIESAHPLTPLQQGMLFDIERSPAEGIYVEQTLCRLDGDLDGGAFAVAWRKVLERHPALRTAFVWRGLDEPRQEVHRLVEDSCSTVDLSALGQPDRERVWSEAPSRERRRPFHIDRPPLTRLTVLRFDPDRCHVIWTSSHLIIDAWCLGVLLEELFTLYGAFRRGLRAALPPAVPFRRAVDWIRSQRWPEARQFWHRRLTGVDAPALLAEQEPRARVAAPQGAFSQQIRSLDEGESDGLRSFARGHHLTLNVVAAGAWALELARQTGSLDVVFGLVVSGRGVLPASIRETVGVLINTLPLRVTVDRESELDAWLSKLQDQQLEVLAYEQMPLPEIVRAAQLEGDGPLFDTLFVFLNAADAPVGEREGLTISEIRATGRSTFPLTVRIYPETCLGVEMLYDPSRFSPTRIEELLASYTRTLSRISAERGGRIGTFVAKERRWQMDDRSGSLPDLEALMSVQPRAVSASGDSLVKTRRLSEEERLPLVIEPALDGVDLPRWVEEHREFLDRELRESGGVLFRGFSVPEIADFERFCRTISPSLLEYRERSTPRTEVQGRIYTSTEYPADQTIAFHNEFSYARAWPLRIVFHCVTPADDGGETPLADSRRVLGRLPDQVRERFERRGVLYVRSFGSGIDLTWQEVFQTEEREDVEEYCREAGVEFEWLEEGRLRTRQRRPATARHPVTGEDLWFNQADLFHISNLAPEVRDSLLEVLPYDRLPRNAFFGDGGEIPEEDLRAVRRAFDEVAVVFRWQKGDILLLDNMLIAHGRRPFTGPRKIVVAMGERFSPAAGAEG